MTVSDYISRADAIEAVIEYWDGYAKPLDSWDVMNQTRAVLETIPSADAVKYESTVTLNSPISISAEAVQGEWMWTEHDDPCYFRCSNCGRMSDEDSDFCPNCGAKMSKSKPEAVRGGFHVVRGCHL